MLDRLLARMGSEPWYLDASRFDQLVDLAALGDAKPEALLGVLGIRPQPLAVCPGAAPVDRPLFDVVGSTAVVHIWGILDERDADVTFWGIRFGTSYESIARAVQAAVADDRVSRVVLNIDSPGGAARPIENFSKTLFAVAESGRQGGKPLIALTNHLMASAAAYLGLQADKVYTTSGGWTGSIGVRLQAVDVSGALNRIGIKVNTVKSGEFKDLGNPYRAMTDRDRAKLQAEVDQYFGMFIDAVARGRRMDAAKVRAIATGEGFIGQKAVDAGLVDGVRDSLAALLAELNQDNAAGATGRGTRGRAAAAVKEGGTAAPGSISMDPQEVANKAGGTGSTTTTTTTPTEPTNKAPENKGPDLKIDGVTVAGAVATAMAAEAARVRAIEATCRPYSHVSAVEKIRQEALVDQTATAESVSAKVLAAITASQTPVGSMDLSIGSDGWDRERGDMESSVIARIRPDLCDTLSAGDDRAHRIARALGHDDPKALATTMRRGRDAMSRKRLIDMAERCAVQSESRFGRRPTFHTHDQVLAAAYGHGSSDFPNLTSNVANKVLLSYFAEQQTRYQRFAAIGSSNDFKSTDLITLSGLNSLLLTPEGAPLKEATINERKEAIRVYTYGRRFSITREMMVNDDLGGIQKVLQSWGVVAARTPELLATQVLTGNPTMADGYALFSNEHGNLGGATALSAAAMEAAVVKMKRQKSFGKDTPYIGIEPKTLLVPSELWGTANRVTKSVIDPTASNNNSATPNVIRELGIDPLDTPHIASATAWYLLGDPNLQPAVQVNFLQGRREPIVTPVGNGSIRGQEQEIIFDCGAKAVGHEAAVYYAGA